MAEEVSPDLVTDSTSTRAAFTKYIAKTQNKRRLSPVEKDNIIQWLTNLREPSSQKECSRRNYVRKSFLWDEATKTLYALPKRNEHQLRLAVTEDIIFGIIESVHEKNGHAGWDMTWTISVVFTTISFEQTLYFC